MASVLRARSVPNAWSDAASSVGGCLRKRVTTRAAAATAVATIVLLTRGSIPSWLQLEVPPDLTDYHLRVPPFRKKPINAKSTFIEHTSFRVKVIPNRYRVCFSSARRYRSAQLVGGSVGSGASPCSVDRSRSDIHCSPTDILGCRLKKNRRAGALKRNYGATSSGFRSIG